MKAMILAAGYGTRLRPLTHKRPKALMPVANIPMVDRIIDYLKAHGVEEIIINAHHHYDQIVTHFNERKDFGVSVNVVVEEKILGTGGGIKNVEDFWDDNPFLVINVDILTDIDFLAALELHRTSQALATLVLHDHARFNQVIVNSHGNVLAFADTPDTGLLAFTGIHIMSKTVLEYIPKGTYQNIIDAYRDIIADGGIISSYVSKGHYWTDIGAIEDYIKANRDMLGSRKILAPIDSHLHPSSELAGWVIIGHRVQIGPQVKLTNSIIWGGVRIGKGAAIEESIITQNVPSGKTFLSRVY